MVLTKKTLRNLLGGVSQQPAPIRLDNQLESQDNFLSDPIKGLTKRPGSEYVAVMPEGVDFNWSFNTDYTRRWSHTIHRSDTENYVFTLDDGNFQMCDLSGNKVDIQNSSGTTISSATYFDYDTDAYAIPPYAAVTIADYTFIVNKAVTVAMEADTTYSGTTASREDGLVFVKEGAYNAKYRVKIINDDDEWREVVVKTSTGLTSDSKKPIDSRTDLICAAIHWGLDQKKTAAGADGTSGSFTAFNTTNAHADYTTEDTTITVNYSESSNWDLDTYFDQYREGSVLSLLRATGGAFTLDTSDSYANSLLKGVKDKVDYFAGLPVIARNGFHLKIEGSPESDLDDYYVKFETNDPDLDIGEGKWVETTEKGISYILDPSTMPLQLVKVNNTLFRLEEVDWDDRLVGDLTTNPNPSFVGDKINDVFFFKSRLGFLSGESVVISELDDPFNFFRTTVTQTLGTDRIDIATSLNEITPLNYAVPFANQMLVFSDSNQFIIDYGSEGLTPQTAALSLVTRYEASKDARPVAIDNSVVFAQDKSNASNILELYPTGTTELSFEAKNISEQIPSYISGDVRRIAASSVSNVLVIQTDETSTNTLYIYKYFNRGSERVISSWSKYSIGGDNFEIRHFWFLNEELYVFGRDKYTTANGDYQDWEYTIQKLKFDNTDTLSYCMDWHMTSASCTETYFAAGDYTTISLPYNVPISMGGGGSLVIIDGNGATGTITDQSSGTSSIRVTGDWTSIDYNLGQTYTSSFVVSDQYLKSQDTAGSVIPIVDGRTTVKWITLFMADSQYMKVQVHYPDQNRTTTSKTFTGTNVGGAVIGNQMSEEGKLRTIVAARNNIPVITGVSDTHQTAVIIGADVELEYNTRLSRR